MAHWKQNSGVAPQSGIAIEFCVHTTILSHMACIDQYNLFHSASAEMVAKSAEVGQLKADLVWASTRLAGMAEEKAELQSLLILAVANNRRSLLQAEELRKYSSQYSSLADDYNKKLDQLVDTLCNTTQKFEHRLQEDLGNQSLQSVVIEAGELRPLLDEAIMNRNQICHKTINDLSAEKVALERSCEDLRKEVLSCVDQIASKNSELENLKRDLGHSEQQLAQKSVENTQLRDRLRCPLTEENSWKSEMDFLEKTLEATSHQLEAKKAELSVTRCL